jgi:hypothetical protein
MNDSPKQPLANTDWDGILDVLCCGEVGIAANQRADSRFPRGSKQEEFLFAVRLQVVRMLRDSFRNRGASRR